ncbi:MAG: hypothetical protein KDA41_17950 [Planctomycetales bacterium]|nr:hypothetical protein [Planctomycetales bacterium]
MNQQPYTTRSRGRGGVTLAELLVSTVAATVLMGGLTSSIYIASQGFEADVSAPAEQAHADGALTQVMRDAQSATEITELTATAATFVVPDRNGDNSPETIRYAWSGTPGDPLTYQLNGGAVETLAEDVQQFNLDYLSRFIAGASQPLLFIFGDDKEIASEERDRVSLFESWGYQVTTLSAHVKTDEFATQAKSHDVAFVSAKVSSGDIGTKLSQLAIGVVNEQRVVASNLGLVRDSFDEVTGTSVTIEDNLHYITSPFATGDLKIMSESVNLLAKDDDLAAGFVGLGCQPKKSAFRMLGVVEAGATLWDGTPAPARRVQLPWGRDSLEVSKLTDDGRTVLKRSLEWASGADNIAQGKSLALPDNWYQLWLQ